MAQPPPSPGRIRTCVIINQLATPGLGSILAGRWVAGVGQLCLALVGFGIFVVWFVQLFVRTLHALSGSTDNPPLHPLMGLLGLGIFIASWLWSGITSLSLLREARREQGASGIPPKVSDPP